MPEFSHESVLVEEVVTALRPRSGGRYVDGTVGGGGHAGRLLGASGPDGWLLGCDRDGDALEAAREGLKAFRGRFQLRRANYDRVVDWVEPGSCDGMLLDLGVSSPQLDWPERGFSFQSDGPLDMRMDRGQALTAAEVVNEWAVADLIDVFRELGEEPGSRRLARAIEQERVRVRFESTRQLAGFLERLNPRRGRKRHPATRVFQALRMVVNDEIGALKRGLSGALEILRPGGRLAVITFHSIEDRTVKLFGNQNARDYVVEGQVDVPELRRPIEPRVRWVMRKPVSPSPKEVGRNPRARSARLRVLERTEVNYGPKTT